MCEHPIRMKFSNKYPIYWKDLPEEQQKLYTKGHISRTPKIDDETREISKKYIPETEIYIDVPCGYCLECKLAKSKNMATRAMCEAMCHKSNCFVTLTYNDKNLPKNKELVKRDMQLFFKRLIKKYPNQGIRRLYCGEYGPRKGRPHYHAIIFGYIPNDLEFYKKDDKGNYLFKSKELQKIWGNGFVTIGYVTAETCGYCARYTLKKAGIKPQRRERIPNPEYNPLNPKRGNNKYLYKKPEKTPEFVISSRRPGIGHIYWEENQEKIKRDKGIWIYSQKAKHVVLNPIPDSFKLKWKNSTDWENYYKFCYEQQLDFKDYQERIIKLTGDTWEEFRRKQIEQLHRRIVRLKRDEEFLIQEE